MEAYEITEFGALQARAKEAEAEVARLREDADKAARYIDDLEAEVARLRALCAEAATHIDRNTDDEEMNFFHMAMTLRDRLRAAGRGEGHANG